MSQPYPPGQPQPGQQPGQPQPGQPQPGGYQQPGYPQGGYPQPGPPAGYGGYQSSGPPTGPSYASPSSGGNPFSTAAGLAPILQILGYVVAGLGVLAGIVAFTIDGVGGSYKFYEFLLAWTFGLGLGGVLLALSVILKERDS